MLVFASVARSGADLQPSGPSCYQVKDGPGLGVHPRARTNPWFVVPKQG